MSKVKVSSGIKVVGNSYIEISKYNRILHFLQAGVPVLLYGPTGAGKTTIVKQIAMELKLNFCYYNLGQSQDPQSYLIGETGLSKGETYFNPSPFLSDIQSDKNLVVLDELSRMHPEAGNILLSILDPLTRAVNVPNRDIGTVVAQAKFVGTANFGAEYTGTKIVDRALVDRMVLVYIGYLQPEQEKQLLKEKYPNLSDKSAEMLIEIASKSRAEVERESNQLSSPISTRYLLLAASMLTSGFTWGDVGEMLLDFYLNNDDKQYVRTLFSLFPSNYKNNNN